MNLKSTSQLIASVLILGIVGTTSFAAPPLTDSPQRIEQQRADLSGSSEEMEVITSTAEYKPGESIDLHFHHGIEAAYVIQGAMVKASGKEPFMLATGTSVLNLRDVKHGGIKVVGETSLKLFTVHITDKGKPLYDYSN